MNSTDRILESQIGTQFATTSRGGDPNAANFRVALAKADGAAGPGPDHPRGADRNKHVVKAGETLYGIANARLAASGQPATPGASMRYALQIAKANQIRNPDRILTGQQLELSPAAATISGRDVESVAGSRSIALSDSTAPRALHAKELQRRIAETVRQDDAGEYDSEVADLAPPNPALPRVAADDGITSHAASVVPMHVDLALYRQISPVEAPRPSGEVPDIVYKGMVGKALDLVPLESSTRIGLQQANAVIGNSFAGRSIAALTGLGGPLLTLAGLVWGIFSAQKIGATPSDAPKQVAQNMAAEIVR